MFALYCLSWIKRGKLKAMNKLTHILLALGLLPAVGFGDPGKTNAEINYQKIHETIDRVLVTVEYKAEMTFMGQSDDIEGRVPGLTPCWRQQCDARRAATSQAFGQHRSIA